MSPKAGRPRKGDADKKTVRLEIRLTEAENQVLNELSEKMGLSKTDTILKAVTRMAKKK